MRTARAVPTPWLCRKTIISRITCCSAQAATTRCALGANAIQLLQAIGRLLDDLEDGGAEGLHEFAGEVGPNAFHHPGAEIAFDALERGGRHDAQLRGLELEAMRPIRHPPALPFDVCTWCNRGRRADHGDEVAVTTHLDTEDAKARLLTVKGDALHTAGEVFHGRMG